MSHVTLDPEFPPTVIQAEQILLGKLHGTLYRVVVQRIDATQPIDATVLALLPLEGVHPVPPPQEAVQ
jgi:hypothetical protein